MKTAIEILQEKVTEAAFYLDIDEVNVIVAAMEEYHQQQLKILNIPDVVQQSEQFKAIVFKMANMLAIAGEGDQAVQMHRIHNSL